MRMMLYHSLLHERDDMQQEKTGEIMSKAVQDVDLCVEGMRKVTTEIFDTGVLMLSYFLALMSYDPWMTLCAGVFIPFSMIIAEKMKKIVARINQKARAQSAQVAVLTVDQADHAALYRILGREKANLETFDRALSQLEKDMIAAEVLENAMQPLYNAIALTGMMVVLTMGTERVLAGTFSVGDFSAVVTMFIALALKASKASKLFNTFQKASVSWKRIQPALKPPAEEESEAETDPLVCDLVVRNLSFGYPDQKKLIEGLSFEAHAGQIIGVTGPIACGKSTLGRLLEGSLSYEGSIQLDGKELRDLNEAQRARQIARQAHDPQLFSWTIEENIRLDALGDLSLALEQAALENDLKTMPLGVKTLVGFDGNALSGGQQARIALARTLYRKSPIIILDDPFSAVDSKTERDLIGRLREDFPDSIIFLISHRLAYFYQLDQVLLFNGEGKFLIRSHEELMEISDLYRELVLSQSGKEQQ